MQVQKRNSEFEEVSFDKVKNRLKLLCNNLTIDPIIIAQKVCSQIFNGIKTSELDELSAQICMSLMTENIEYGELGSRVIISNSHKNTSPSFSETMFNLYNNTDINDYHYPLISEEVYNIIINNKDKFNSIIDYNRDYNFDFFSYKTLEKAYLLKINGKISERIQDLFLRVSIGLHKHDIKSAIDSYNFMSNKYFTHATPTLFHGGTPKSQYLSCFIKGTPLLTINNGIKNIEDIKIGDQVITHLGNCKTVSQLHTNNLINRKLLNITCDLTPIITTTNNHKFWSILNSNNELKPDWNEISSLQKNDYIAIPNYKGELENYNIDNYNIVVNTDFSKFLGIWYSIGSFITENNQIIGLQFKTTNTLNHILYYCSNLINKIFNFNSNFNIDIINNIAVLEVYNNTIIEIFQKLFINLYSNIFKWTNNLIYSFLGGLLSNNKNFYCNTNIYLVKTFYHLFRTRGILVKLKQSHILEFMYNKHIINEILLNTTDTTDNIKSQFIDYTKNILVFNEQIFIKINIIEEYIGESHEFVYNIGVDDDNSYEINGIVAKNCFLLGMEDSVSGIYKTLSDCSQISKWAGGIGIHISNIRSKGAIINGTNGIASGLIPMLRVFNDSSRHINQCILPDIIVYSKNGFKKMEDITTKDFLITKDGSFKKVNKIFINEKNEEILNIKVQHSIDNFKCTYNHDIMVIKHLKITHKKMIDRLNRKISNIEFIQASELTTNHYMGFPIPIYENDIENFTEDNARMYGILAGDGCISHNIKSYSHRFQINLNKNSKKDTLNFVLNYLDNNNIHYWENQEDEYCWTYNKESIKKLNIDENMLYDENREKKINTEFLYLPKTKIAMILKGLLETDGCINKRGEIYFTSTSKNLIYSVKYMLLRLGILSSTNTIDKIGQIMSYNKNNRPIISRKLSYNLRIPRVKLLKDMNIVIKNYPVTTKVIYFRYNNILWSRVKDIKKTQYEGKVYDFNMIDNHNYLTESGLVHNSGKRNGSFAMYLEPHHPDILDFLEIRKNHGNEDERARDLFTAVWVSDLFMEKVDKDQDWCLFDPNECPNLNNVYGDEYKQLYAKYEQDGKARKVLKARIIWKAINTSQIETGTPYIGFKDAVNKKNNLSSYDTIKSSNLCIEVNLPSDEHEYACCCLASICLPKFIEDGEFKFNKLIDVCKTVVNNLNKVIDDNYYPVPETKKSNMLHRPLGIGIQGLSDVFSILKMPFDSPEAKQFNITIFETLYYGCIVASMELAKRDGPYITYTKENALKHKNTFIEYFGENVGMRKLNNLKDSPISQGLFQFDLWNTKPTDRYNWDELRQNIKQYGIRNSVLTALMPTASTSQIMGNNEAFEPVTSNIYVRRTIAGDFIVVNKHLIKDLTELNLWSTEIKDLIIANQGSIQKITNIPDNIKLLYKTVWEIKQKVIIDMAADRGPYICQTQSMNLFFEEPTFQLLTSALFYAWKKGLKSGSYYIRSKPNITAQQFTISDDIINKMKFSDYQNEVCESCSS
jgi:ribonucleoside-diphosphate reductase alpha subunit